MSKKSGIGSTGDPAATSGSEYDPIDHVHNSKPSSPLLGLRQGDDEEKNKDKIAANYSQKASPPPSIRTQPTKTQQQKDAENNLWYLHALQLIPCAILVGGYGRMTATSVNFYDRDFFFTLEGEIMIPLITVIAVSLDILYYTQMAKRDNYELQDKINKFNNAASGLNKNSRMTSEQSTKILNNAQSTTSDILSRTNENKIICILEHDIFIQQLLIQANIQKNDLIKKYRKDNTLTISALLETESTNLARKDYEYSHPWQSKVTEYIEYLQAIKVPLRLAGVLLLLRTLSPDEDLGLGVNSNGTWGIMGALCALMWVACIYASVLEFRKQKNINKYDQEINKILNTRHNVLMATLLYSLNRKVKSMDKFSGENANTSTKKASFWDFESLIFFKLLPSILCLGTLGRRPFTLFALTGENNPSSGEISLVLSLVGALMALDFAYMYFSLKEERWKLKKAKESNTVLEACYGEENSESKQNPDNLSENEKALEAELRASHQDKPPKNGFEIENPGWAFIGACFENTQFMKFALRGMSMGYTIPTFVNATEHKEHVVLPGVFMDKMDLIPAMMIAGALIGLAMGFLIREFNRVRDGKEHLGKKEKGVVELLGNFWKKRTSIESPAGTPEEKHESPKETIDPQKQFTKNTMLFFRDNVTAAAPKSTLTLSRS